jgi:hypothetical protein
VVDDDDDNGYVYFVFSSFHLFIEYSWITVQPIREVVEKEKLLIG